MTEKDLFVGTLNDVYGEFLNGKQSRIISAYYDEDLSLAEIAENEGITRQAVLDLIKRTSAKLYKWEEKCRYAEKIRNLQDFAEKVKNGDRSAISHLLEEIDNF